MRNSDELLTRARARLLMKAPFFGAIALHLNYEPSATEKTMATDGSSIFYNPDWMAELPPAQLRGVLAHEICHVANGHHCRRGDRNPRLWNIACDHVINLALLADGFELPDGALKNSAYEGWSAEAVYRELAKNADPQSDTGSKTEPSHGDTQPNGSSTPVDYGGCGRVIDANSVDADGAPDMAAADRHRRELALKAAAAVESAGQLSPAIADLIREARHTRTNWRATLRDFLSECQPRDYSLVIFAQTAEKVQ